MKSAQAFVDEALITVESGAGGNGMVGFRREKFVAHGGPNGGDGGHGGNVILIADSNLSTLLEFQSRRILTAGRGQNGGPNGRTGARGEDLEIRLPIGTIVRDAEEDVEAEPLIDLSKDGQCFTIARGGNGGFGNQRFKTSTRQAPDFALDGRPGQTCQLRLSLKLLADVGLVGFPNAGKSTLLTHISSAHPKIASYPFTTLTPSLGVVELDHVRFVVADIPGLIEGASEGAGLGHQFLRHVERTRVIVHLLDLGAFLLEKRDLLADYDAIRQELGLYRPDLLERQEIVVLSKLDLVTDLKEVDDLEEKLKARGITPMRLSAASRVGTSELIRTMLTAVENARKKEAEPEDGQERSDP
ncbi:MAG: GTPase ObgE [Deltaproteobacteria bacterium]|nr:GTPase ObgE [Deltaproteobacteria bacterium]